MTEIVRGINPEKVKKGVSVTDQILGLLTDVPIEQEEVYRRLGKYSPEIVS